MPRGIVKIIDNEEDISDVSTQTAAIVALTKELRHINANLTIIAGTFSGMKKFFKNYFPIMLAAAAVLWPSIGKIVDLMAAHMGTK